MKNGWKKLFIISLIIILLEIVGAVVVMLPFYTRNMVFVNIDKGDASKTKGYFDMLNDAGQEKVYSYLDDFAATICQDYIDGKKTYEETVASLDAIREIEGNNNIADGYINDVASNEFKKLLNDIYDADLARDSNKGYSLKPDLDLVKQRLNNDTREELMVTFLNEKYRSFLNQEIGSEGILAACAVVKDNSYYKAYDYAEIISANAESVVLYRGLYAELQQAMANQNYFEILDKCEFVEVDKWDTAYKNLFDELYDSAYETGKEYYAQKLSELVASDDKKTAVELMDQIEKYYGSEIDTGSARNQLFESWQLAYLDFMETFDPASSSHSVNTVLLFDINDDDIPEMFLFDIADIEMAYIGCEVYNVGNNKCKDLGYYNIINICDCRGLPKDPTKHMDIISNCWLKIFFKKNTFL